MHDALFVRRLEGFGDLPGNPQRFVHRQTSCCRDATGEGLPFDELQHECAIAVRVFDAVDRADMRVIDRRQHARLSLEPRAPLRIVEEGSGQNLDRHVASEFRIPGAIDLSHAPGTELLDDLVMSDLHTCYVPGARCRVLTCRRARCHVRRAHVPVPRFIPSVNGMLASAA